MTLMTIEDARLHMDLARNAATHAALAAEYEARMRAVRYHMEGKDGAAMWLPLFEAEEHHDAYISIVRSAPRRRRNGK